MQGPRKSGRFDPLDSPRTPIDRDNQHEGAKDGDLPACPPTAEDRSAMIHIGFRCIVPTTETKEAN
jgi:hypothetical protein